MSYSALLPHFSKQDSIPHSFKYSIVDLQSMLAMHHSVSKLLIISTYSISIDGLDESGIIFCHFQVPCTSESNTALLSSLVDSLKTSRLNVRNSAKTIEMQKVDKRVVFKIKTCVMSLRTFVGMESLYTFLHNVSRKLGVGSIFLVILMIAFKIST